MFLVKKTKIPGIQTIPIKKNKVSLKFHTFHPAEEN